jgi:hypothetical protein
LSERRRKSVFYETKPICASKPEGGGLEKTNPAAGDWAGEKRTQWREAGRKARGKNWGKSGRKQGEFLESINNNASDVKYSWFLGWVGVNFYLSADVKKRSQPRHWGGLKKRTQWRSGCAETRVA